MLVLALITLCITTISSRASSVWTKCIILLLCTTIVHLGAPNVWHKYVSIDTHTHTHIRNMLIPKERKSICASVLEVTRLACSSNLVTSMWWCLLSYFSDADHVCDWRVVRWGSERINTIRTHVHKRLDPIFHFTNYSTLNSDHNWEDICRELKNMRFQ